MAIEQIQKGLYFLFAVFLVLLFVYNVSEKIPRFPWDFLVDKFGFRVYIPIITAIILTILLSLIL